MKTEHQPMKAYLNGVGTSFTTTLKGGKLENWEFESFIGREDTHKKPIYEGDRVYVTRTFAPRHGGIHEETQEGVIYREDCGRWEIQPMLHGTPLHEMWWSKKGCIVSLTPPVERVEIPDDVAHAAERLREFGTGGKRYYEFMQIVLNWINAQREDGS